MADLDVALIAFADVVAGVTHRPSIYVDANDFIWCYIDCASAPIANVNGLLRGLIDPIHHRSIVAGADIRGVLMRSEKLLWQPKVARALAVIIQLVVGDGAWPLTAKTSQGVRFFWGTSPRPLYVG